MNGTVTHAFMRLDNKTIIKANHVTALPFPPMCVLLWKRWTSQKGHRKRKTENGMIGIEKERRELKEGGEVEEM